MDNWITILTFTYPHEAHLVKGKLESEDISVQIKDELVAQVNNFYSTAIGGVKLQVLEKDFDKAYLILINAGYIKEQKTEQNRILSQFDLFTSRIPVFGKLIIEMRLIIAIALILVIIIVPVFILSIPSKLEVLTKNRWCVESIFYKGQELTPNSYGIKLKSTYDNCYETMSFNENGEVIFPGINSYSERAHWEYRNDSIIITQLPDVRNFAINENLEIIKTKPNKDTSIYRGSFKLEINNNRIALLSDSLTIIGKVFSFNYSF